MKDHYVDLNRRFENFLPEEDSEVAVMRSYLTGFIGGESGSSWDEVLKHRLVVVLGEPGSGKSEEFRYLASVGKENGKATFLLELNRLVTEGVGSVLGEVGFLEFSQWKATSSEATFFLDAVDESKLQRIDDFLVALDRLQGVITQHLHRCRFVISSRISAWRPETDRVEVIRRFGLTIPPPGEESIDPISIVTLMPLDRQRVELMAQGRGIADPAAFIAAVDKHDAWDFARRPLDVIELYRYWQEHTKLGSLTELMEFSCGNLIKEVERKDKHDPLPNDRAREGVELLAVASLLTRQVNLRIEDEREITLVSAVNIRDVLPPSWPNDQQKAVLDRALFDAASYGMLRFHHRRHSEYLAAKCMLRFLNNNCPYTEIEEILFAEVDGLWTIRPSLEPVAAWLAGMAETPSIRQLRQRVLEVAPDIHLRYGDPSALPLHYRKSVLKALVDRYKGRTRVSISWDGDALKRLASPDLSGDVSAYLTSTETPEDLKCDLFMLVARGHLSDCCVVAVTMLGDPTTSENLRRYATVAIRGAGTPPIRRQAYDALIGMVSPSSNLIGTIIEACFPLIISTEELLDAIRMTPEISRNSGDLPYILEKHLGNVLTYETSVSILKGVLVLLREPPLIEEKSASKRYAWTVELIPLCLQRILCESIFSSNVVELIVDAVRVLESKNSYGWWNPYNNRNEARDISTALDRHPNVKCALYWRRVIRHRDKHGKDPYLHSLHGNYIVPNFSVVDLEWMKTDLLRKESSEADRLLLLNHMLTIARQDKKLWKLCLRALPSLLRFDIELWKFVAKRLTEMAYSPIWLFMQRQHHNGIANKYWWMRKKREAIKKWNGFRDLLWLWRHRSELASGKFVPTIAKIAMDSRTQQSSRDVIDWNAVVEKWGRLISQSIRSGSEAVWRQHKPVFPYEKIDNRVEDFVLAGLPGLESLWTRDALDFNAMTADEVDLAVRYACRELNGFPEWFPQLLAQRPTDVSKALMLAIAGEWEFPPDQQHVHGVLSTLVWQDFDMQAIILGVVKLLKISDPKNHQMLIHALDFILKSAEGRAMASVLAAEREPMHVLGSEPWFSWIGAWLRVDGVVALNAIEKHVAELPLLEADAVMLGICSNLHGQRERQTSGAMPALSYREQSCLCRLIPLVMQHIRPSEDRDRSNGRVYSPDARDDAARFRDLLWEVLRDSASLEADNVLRDLLDNPVMLLERDWIQELLDRRRSKRADDVPWKASDVRNFAEKHLIAPRSDDTLYRLICRHLKDLKAGFERPEIPGARKKLRRGDREDSLRNLLHDELKQRAGDWYSVTAESEIDLAQRPDLTIGRLGLNSLPIEVKLANLNHWPLHKLLERLENQLIGQYLRAENVRYGVYVLGNVHPKRRWQDVGSGAMIDFQTLVQRVTDRARNLENENRLGVNGIAVIGVDFSDPRERK